MEVITDSLLTHYHKTGKGRTILMLHGWGNDLTSFNELSKQLSVNYQVVALDLPGFGKTAMPPKTWGLQDYATFIKNFLTKIDCNNIYAIVGHSNGGAIAIKALAENILSSQKLILIASAGVRNNQQLRKKILVVLAKVTKLLISPLPKKLKLKLRKKAYGAIGSDLLVVENMQDTFKKVVGSDVVADCPKIDAPALIIYGDNDKATPIKYGKILAAKIPNAKLETILSAGHFVHQTNTAEVAKLIEDFLK